MKRFIVLIFLKRLYYQRLTIVRGAILRLSLRGSHREPKQSQGGLRVISGDCHALQARNDNNPHLFRFFILLFPFFLLAQDNYEFGQSTIVNDDTPGTHNRATTQRSIACHSDTVYLVWGDNRYGNPIYSNSRVFFSKSTDAGSTWSSNQIISQHVDDYPCGIPHICLDGSERIYVAYWGRDNNDNNSDIYFVKSTNGGVSFTSPLIVNDSVEVHHQVYPSIAVDSSGQYVYVVWQDWRNLQYEPDIYFARSTDGGSSFLPSVRVNDDFDTTNQWYPVVACDNSGQNVYVAWMDGRDTLHGWDVYFSRSTDYGQTFGPNYPVNDTITTGSTTQGYPSIYYKEGIIFAVWRDERDSHLIYSAKSIDNGVSFEANVPVRDDIGGAGSDPSITADDSLNIYIVWYDTRNYSTYGYDIYFSFSGDSGQTFHPNVLVNDHEGVVSAWDWNPSVCVNDSGKVFVAWSSTRNDPSLTNFDIYFAAGNYVGIQEYCDPKPTITFQCYPNPFREKIDVRWKMTDTQMQDARSKNQDISLKIYDVAGKLVKSFSYLTTQSFNQITWLGEDKHGHQVPAGIYFVELVNSNKKYVKKIVKVVK